MSYLSKYKKKKKFQERDTVSTDFSESLSDGGGEEQIIMLAQASAAGDKEASAELGSMLAPMVLQEAQAANIDKKIAPIAQPVFRKGGVFVGKRT